MVSLTTFLLTAGTVLFQFSSAAPQRGGGRPPHSTPTRRPQSSTAIPSIPSSTKAPPSQPTSIAVPAASSAAPAPPPSGGTIWKPTVGTTWQIELSTTPTKSDIAGPYAVFDIDLIENSASTISALHAAGKKVICYFSAGTFEDWRPDASSFQSSDLGSPMEDWPGESWLNTKSANVRSIMTARIELARSKGCDGVDPDNVDAYNNANGLGLTTADAVDYLRFLAGVAHSKGLAIGLKNAGDVVGKVLDVMEWEVNEQCTEYDECEQWTPFIKAGKPVFHIEYPSGAPSISSEAKSKVCNVPSGFSTVLKKLSLDGWIATC